MNRGPTPSLESPTRRRWLVASLAAPAALAGTGWLVGCSSAPSGGATLDAAQGITLDAWLRLDPQGHLHVAAPWAEMGQGVHTALALLAADELDMPWSRVHVEARPDHADHANTQLLAALIPLHLRPEGAAARAAHWGADQLARSLSLNITGGSTSVRSAWWPLRWAGAAARQQLVNAAAQAWGVAPDSCHTQDGQVLHPPSGRRTGYGELVATWLKGARPPAPVAHSRLALKTQAQRRLVGSRVMRLDTPDKSNGQARFGIDTRWPGQRFASLRLCPFVGGHLKSVNAQAVRAMPGVIDVITLEHSRMPAVAVVANSTWQAIQAARALEVQWDTGLQPRARADDLQASLSAALADEPGWGLRQEGDAPATWAEDHRRAPERSLSAEYQVPYLAHAALEPLNATAWLDGQRLKLSCGTQVPTIARWRAAQLAGLAMDQVELSVPFLGGGFGRRLEVDVIEQAVELAVKLPGQPVQVLWSREDEFQHDVYRPAALSQLKASWDDQGRLRSWHHRVAAASVGDGLSRRWMPAGLRPWMLRVPDKLHIEGADELPYAVPHLRIDQVMTESLLPVGSWRSVGHSHNAFFNECFIDELAQALQQDPVDLRLSWLRSQPRLARVLQAAAQHAGWPNAAEGRALGVALHACYGSVCAQVAEVGNEGGQPRVHRVVVAFDGGTLVHPATVQAQLEGSVAFGLSAALWGHITVDQGQVEQRSFAQQPLVRMNTMPQVEVLLLDSDGPPGGAGEAGVPPVAPAVANAWSRLTGERRRRLPLVG